VEKVQEDQLAIARYLIREHGLKDVYFARPAGPAGLAQNPGSLGGARRHGRSGAASSARADPRGRNPWAAAAQWRDRRGADSGR
jgi:hypothetical protein